MSTKESGISVKTITETAIMAALICVLGPLSVPVGPVPVSLAPFAIFLTVCVLGEKKGTAAVLIYLLWPDRRFPGRLYPGGADRGMGFRPFPQ